MNFFINRFAELNVSDAVDGAITGQAADHTFTVTKTEESASVDTSVEGFQAGTYTVTVNDEEVEVTIAEDGTVTYDGDLSALDGVTVSIPQADGDPINVTIVTSETPMQIGTEDEDGNITKLAAGTYTLVTDDYDPTDEEANIADYQWTVVVDADGHITSASGPDDQTLEDIPDSLVSVPADPTTVDAPTVDTTGTVSGTLTLNGVTYNVSLENGTYAISGGDVNYSGSSAEYSTEVTSVVGTYTINAGDSGVSVTSTGTAEEVAIETIPGGNTATFANGVVVVSDDDGNILSVTGADDASQSDSGVLTIGDYTYNFSVDGETASLTVDPSSIQAEEVNFADNEKTTTATVTVSAGEYTLVFDLADGESTLVSVTDAQGNELSLNDDASAFLVGETEYPVSLTMDDPESFASIVASYTVPGDASGTADYQSESVISATTYTGNINSLGQDLSVSFSVVDETSYTDENGITWTIDTENLSAVSDGGASTTGLGQIVGGSEAQNGSFTATGVVNAADVTVIGEVDASGTVVSMTVNGTEVTADSQTFVLGSGGEYTVEYADGTVTFTNTLTDTTDTATFASAQEAKDAFESGTAIAVGDYNLQVKDGALTGVILNSAMDAEVDSATGLTVDTASNTYTFDGTTYAIDSVSGTTVNLVSGQGSVALTKVDSLADLDQVGEYYESAASNGTASGTFKVGSTNYTINFEYADGAVTSGTIVGDSTITLSATDITALTSTAGYTGVSGVSISLASNAFADNSLDAGELTVSRNYSVTFTDSTSDATDGITTSETQNAASTMVTYKFDDTHYYAFLVDTTNAKFVQPETSVTQTIGNQTITFTSANTVFFSSDTTTWSAVSDGTFN
ncbi:MAG: hypothetical protein IJ728_12105, partial [Selenomonadaceae bacterium]|nr:hypothetical protein [Selenomonadaceae bacterium]